MPMLLHRLCTLCSVSYSRSRAFFPPAARQPLISRRHFARQASGKLVAQARKSALLRELEELQQEAEDSQTPAGKGLVCLSSGLLDQSSKQITITGCSHTVGVVLPFGYCAVS